MASAWVQISALALLPLTLTAGNERRTRRSDYCIVGAGPAGIQMSHFMQTTNPPMDYVVFERDWGPASFFRKYPRHRRLLSINKRFTGRGLSTPGDRDYNLRHDWHSFLSNDAGNGDVGDGGRLLFTHFSDRFFPLADEYLEYVRAFVNKTQPRVLYGHRVYNVKRLKQRRNAAAGCGSDNTCTIDDYQYQLKIQKWAKGDAGAGGGGGGGGVKQRGGMRKKQNIRWYCKRLLIATGTGKENVPNWSNVELTESYGSFDANPKRYTDKRIGILGGGNSAWEVINSLMHETAALHQFSGKRVLAENTHYPGHLRSANTIPFDNYKLKTQDVWFYEPFPLENVTVRRDAESGQVCLFDPMEDEFRRAANGSWGDQYDDGHALNNRDRIMNRQPDCFDHVIRCMGFAFDASGVLGDLADELPRVVYRGLDKFPQISAGRFESTALRNVFFLGANAHAPDFRRSSGGFIYGFRYNIRTLFHHLRHKFHGVPWPQKRFALLQGATGRDGGDDGKTTAAVGEDGAGSTPHPLQDEIVARYQTASSFYHMFGVLGDLMVITSRDGEGEVIYYYDVVVAEAEAFIKTQHPGKWEEQQLEYITLTFEYMPQHNDNMIWGDSITTSFDPSRPHNSKGVHPTLRYWNPNAKTAYKSLEAWALRKLVPRATAELYLMEDMEFLFDDPVLHLFPLRKFLERIKRNPVRTPDAEYDMGWLCPTCDKPRPEWRELLREECSSRDDAAAETPRGENEEQQSDRQRDLCKALE
eukprot:jgi/Bigna1/70166/fgenesh1_pg.11_\